MTEGGENKDTAAAPANAPALVRLTALWQRLNARKVVQWSAAYLALAYGALQGVALIADTLAWPASIARIALGLLVAGFPIAVIVAWYHGERGRQHVTRIEVGMIGACAVGGIALATFLAGATPGTPTGALPRLAVLRLESLGNTEPYFAEGVADELISEVSRIQGMEVTARASSFSLTGANATPANAAHELGATLVLTGSVRRLPDGVRVNAQLSEAPSGRSVWTRTFERPANEAFLLERDIAVRVAQAADARVTAPAPQRVDPEAYNLYLQGRELQLGVAETGWTTVRDHFREAVTRDPNFAEAWAALARAEANVASEQVSATAGQPLTDAALAPAFAAADRALALDNSLSDPFLVRALAHAWLGHWRLAAEAAAQAVRRGGVAGNFYRALGYIQKAVDARKHSADLNPLAAVEWNNLAYTGEYNADAECQLSAARRAHDLAPDDTSATRGLVRALIASGRNDEAYRLVQDAGWMHDVPSVATRVLVAMAHHGTAPSTQEMVHALDIGQGYIDTTVGSLADLQRWDAAAALLDRWGAADRSTLFGLFRAQWAPLRRTPQFWAVMDRMGVVQYWRASGQWPDFCAHEPVCDAHRHGA